MSGTLLKDLSKAFDCLDHELQNVMHTVLAYQIGNKELR